MIDNRARIIEAAARVFAAHGYRGATTRRIAEEAGVNEVTLFRQFGTKSALLGAMVEESTELKPIALPRVPSDPEGELVAWVTAHMAAIAHRRDLLRQLMRQFTEHPELATCAGKGPADAAAQLRSYVASLRTHGFLDADAAGDGDGTIDAAVTMLMSAFWVDAMDRELMPDLFRTPAATAPRSYVRLFLRGIGVASPRATGAPAGSPPASPPSTPSVSSAAAASR